MHRFAARYFPALCLLLGALSSTPAHASDAMDATAKELFKAGAQAHQEGNWEECRAKMTAAWAVKQHPKIAGLLGECELKLERFDEAAEHLDYFLRKASDKTPAALKERATELLTKAESKVARIEVTASEDDAEIRVDARTVGSGTARLWAKPGNITVTARKAGFKTASKSVEAKQGTKAAVSLTLEPIGDQPPANGHPNAVLLGVGYGLGGAAVVVGGIFAGLAASASSQADEVEQQVLALGSSPCPGPAVCNEHFDLRQESSRNMNAALWLFVSGGAALAATATYHIVTSQSGDAKTSLFISPAPLGARLHLSF